MSRTIIFLVLAGILGWGVFHLLQPAPIPAVAPVSLSPEQQLRQLLTAPQVDAPVLAALCDNHPQLANRILKDASLRLTGSVEGFRLLGLGGRRADVILQRGSPRELGVVYDLDHYTPVAIDRSHRDLFRIHGNQLLLIEYPTYRDSRGNLRVHRNALPISHILHTRTDEFRGNVTFAGITRTAIFLHAIPRPKRGFVQ